MRVNRVLAVLGLVSMVLSMALGGGLARAEGPSTPPGQWPVSGADGSPPTVARGFDPPRLAWLAGHRGVDLVTHPGQAVRAAASGRVSFASRLAGRGVVVVDHGTVRTTYEPVRSTVAVGQLVVGGERIGVIESAGSHCAPTSCLHWGLRTDEDYFDPLSMVHQLEVAAGPVKLLPRSAADVARERADQREEAVELVADLGWPSPVAPGIIGSKRPADGPITSRFGMRKHPVTGIYKLHDGTDVGAACGSPIRSVLPGRVASVQAHRAYGWWLIVDHGAVNGVQLKTGYAHASGYIVAVGQFVQAGEHLGAVGTTGWSTGCHLHFMSWVNGQITDPTRFL